MNYVEDYIFKLPLWQRKLIIPLRDVILNSAPGIDECIKYKIPFYNYKKRALCYINPRKKDVVVGFIDGVELSKSNVILIGNQKMVRHFEVSEINENICNILAEIIQEALILSDLKKKQNPSKKFRKL